MCAFSDLRYWCRVLILGATLAAAKTTGRTAQHTKEILRNRLEVCYILLYIYAQITWVVVEGYANFICDNTVYVDYRNVLSPPLPKKRWVRFYFFKKNYFIFYFGWCEILGDFFCLHLCCHKSQISQKVCEISFSHYKLLQRHRKKLLLPTKKYFSTQFGHVTGGEDTFILSTEVLLSLLFIY